jgi:hypothetical protein
VAINHYPTPNGVPDHRTKGLLDGVLEAPEGSLLNQEAREVLEGGGTVETSERSLSLNGSLSVTDHTTQVGLTLEGSVERGSIQRNTGDPENTTDDRLVIRRDRLGVTLGVSLEETNPGSVPPVADPPYQESPTPVEAEIDSQESSETPPSTPAEEGSKGRS